MSFFSNGLAGIVNNRRKKKGAKKDDKEKSSGKKDKKGEWEMFTDAYGRTYWKHSVTGEWSHGNGGAFGVSPVSTVNPSPMGFYPMAFTPSPGFVVAPTTAAAKKDKKKDEDKRKGKGWWETMHDEDGDRYWKHTVTKKTTYKDSYF